MREIKFRGKRIDNGDWLYGDLIHINEQTLIHPTYDEPYQYDELDENVDPKTVGQLTSIQDKNGTDIYEGDIFEAPHDFGPGGFDVRRSVVKFHEMHGYQWNYWLTEQLEVIGNIYDNPELLEANHET